MPGERTKNRREHLIPLAPVALAVLAAQPRRVNADGTPRDLIFGRGEGGWKDWSGSKDELNARIQPPIHGWNLHDLRRSISTGLHEKFDTPPHIVELILGHAQGGVAGIYNKANYVDQRRVALKTWADHIVSLATGEKP